MCHYFDHNWMKPIAIEWLISKLVAVRANGCRLTWFRNEYFGNWFIGSKCEWNWSTIVNGTFSKYSVWNGREISVTHSSFDWEKKTYLFFLPIMKPTVTSSGKRMRSLIAVNLSPRINGLIFWTNGRLMQNPAPPVANQNFILLSLLFDSCSDS